MIPAFLLVIAIILAKLKTKIFILCYIVSEGGLICAERRP